VGKFSIRDIENITGIKAHTIRIWEQRYNLVVSHRTDTNIRFYDDRDLCRFLTISNLTENGFRISEVAKMTTEEMVQKISELSVDHNNPCIHVNALTEAMIQFDQVLFNKTLNNRINASGIIKVMNDTVFPFLRKVGFMWQADLISPAHEHFVTNLIKTRLISAIAQLEEPDPEKSKRFLLFLPLHEHHEMGLWYAHYLIKLSGNRVLFLGQSVPYEDLQATSEKYDPHYCLTTLTSLYSENNVNQIIEELLKHLPHWPLAVSGPLVSMNDIQPRERLTILKSIDDLILFLSQVKEPREDSVFQPYVSSELQKY
jgi:DNA-binding transcriptional MerR regulator